MSEKGGKPDRIMIAEGYKGIRQWKPFLSNRSQRKRGYCTELKKGCRDGIGNCGSASDMFRVRRDMAWVTAATPIQLVHAGPGPATRTVNAANVLVSLPVITSKR